MIDVYFANGPKQGEVGQLPDFLVHEIDGNEYQAVWYARATSDAIYLVHVAFVVGSAVPDTSPPEADCVLRCEKRASARMHRVGSDGIIPAPNRAKVYMDAFCPDGCDSVLRVDPENDRLVCDFCKLDYEIPTIELTPKEKNANPAS